MNDREFIAEILPHLRYVGFEVIERDDSGNRIEGFACHVELDDNTVLRYHTSGPVGPDQITTTTVWIRDVAPPAWARDPGLSNEVARTLLGREAIYDKKRRACRFALEPFDVDRYLHAGIDLLTAVFKRMPWAVRVTENDPPPSWASIGRWARHLTHPEERVFDSHRAQ